jgi:glucuronoarabinoxylan endo-1,4-beta-xylanase
MWVSPWTLPTADKDNNSTVMGHLSKGQSFANELVTVVAKLKNRGISIYAVSAQNEPDANVTRESCAYTGDTIAPFVGTYIVRLWRPPE